MTQIIQDHQMTQVIQDHQITQEIQDHQMTQVNIVPQTYILKEDAVVVARIVEIALVEEIQFRTIFLK